MNHFKHFDNIGLRWSPITTIAITSVVVIATSIYCLSSGLSIIFQNLFYVPIIIACMYYAKKGFVYSLLLAFTYLILALIFRGNSNFIIEPLVRTFIFIGIAGVITFLKIKLKLTEEMLVGKEAIAGSEERFRIPFENSLMGISLATPDGKLIQANRAYIQMYGYRSLDEMNTEVHNIGQLYSNPDDRNKVLRILSEKGVVEVMEIELIRRDGTRFIALVSVQEFRDNEGKLVYNQAHHIDITKLKLAEKKLSLSESRYRELIENSGTSIIIIDIDGRYRLVNKTAAERFGKSKEEIEGKSIFDFLPSATAQKYIESNRALIESGTHREYEDAFLMPAGEKTFLIVDQVLKDENGENYAVQSSAIDITERKRAEEEIILLSHSLKSVNECVSITDLENKILYVNESFLKTYGYDEKELIGKHISIVRSQDKAPDLVGEILPATLRGRWAGELLNKRKDGSEFPIYLSTTIIKDKDGKSLGLIGVATDITERKRAELKLRESERKLNEAQKIGKIGNWEFNFSTNKIKWSDQVFVLYERDVKLGPPTAEEEAKYYTKEQEKMLNDLFNQVIEKGLELSIDIEPILPSGRKVYYSSVMYPIRDENEKVIKIFGTIQDITERKSYEHKLVENESRLSAIFDNAGYSISVGKKGVQVSGNPAFVKLFGYKNISETIGKSVLETIAPEERKRIGKYIIDRAMGLEVPTHYETKGLRQDSSTFDMEVMISKYFINDEMHIVAFQSDITEHKKVREEIIKSHEQLKLLTAHLMEVREKERTEVAREIHDELGQSLAGMKIDLIWLKENIKNKLKSEHKINQMISLMSDTMKTVQKISAELRPKMIDDLGLTSAIEWQLDVFKKRTGIKCNLELEEIGEIDGNISITLFRIFQAALTNIMRHSKAKSISVKLAVKEEILHLSVSDDGIGITQEQINLPNSFGIIGMRERTNQINGRFEIHSRKNEGTEIIVTVSLKK